MALKKFKQERETITLPQEALSEIARQWGKPLEHEGISYKLEDNEITSSDPEDGGADHIVIFKRESDDKYFRFYYSDWDMDYNFPRDFPDSAEEVFPRSITAIIFE